MESLRALLSRVETGRGDGGARGGLLLRWGTHFLFGLFSGAIWHGCLDSCFTNSRWKHRVCWMEILFASCQFEQKMAKVCYSATELLRRKCLGALHPEAAALLSFEGAISTPCAQGSALFTLTLDRTSHWLYHQDLGHSVSIILFTKTVDISENRRMTSCLFLVFQLYFNYTMWKCFIDACRSDILNPVLPDVLLALSILFAWCWAKSKELHRFALHSHVGGCTKSQLLYWNNLKSSVPWGDQLLFQVASVLESIIFKVGDNNTGEWVNSGVSWQKKKKAVSC